MTEYIVRTDKPIRLDEVLHLHGVHNFEVKRMDKHGRLIDADKGLEFYADVLIKNFPATQKATIDEMILGMKKMLDALPTVLEASNGTDN